MAWQSEVEGERKRQAEETHRVEMVRQLSGARGRRRWLQRWRRSAEDAKRHRRILAAGLKLVGTSASSYS